MKKNNEIFDGYITNVTPEWKASHMKCNEVDKGLKECPLWGGHVCYGSCMHHVNDAQNLKEGYCLHHGADNNVNSLSK